MVDCYLFPVIKRPINAGRGLPKPAPVLRRGNDSQDQIRSFGRNAASLQRDLKDILENGKFI